MEGKKLEELMLAFMNGEFDVLVATTIIESGLDVPNANTIFINNANNFGLSDLHQMRGRVGRSNKKAFCYFICPPYSAMTDDARKRIQALEQFSDLGSGFNIAMKDLEIRGAGDLLGGEQSGFINEIGFDTYQKIMNEAIEELKENEFKDLYPTENNLETKEYVKDLQIDTDFELLFSDEYINNISERLSLYSELATVKNEEELQLFQTKLIDRFGPMPPRAIALMNSIRIKWIATQVGIEKLVMKQGKMIGYFVSDQQSDYYQSKRFMSVMSFVQKQSVICKIKEKETKSGLKLLLTFDNVKSTRRALELMKLLGGNEV
jgi:transcription-repair coupling factor (superfamily II helicase)